MKAMVLMGGGCTIRLMLCLMVMMLVCDKYDLLSWWINYGTQKPGQVSRINNSYQLLPRDILLLMEETLSSLDI